MERKNRERALWQILRTVCLVTSFFFAMGHAALAATCPKLRYGPATNGAAMATIPITISPHRPGLVPSLDLTYNSLRPAGWVGRGWDLELGSVKNIGNTFYYAVGNTLEELVKVKTERLGNGWYNDYYALKFERRRGLLTMHYLSQCGTDNSCSIVYSEWSGTLDGRSYTFGTFDSSNSDNIYAYTSYINVGKPLQEQWSLRYIADRYGNFTNIAYEKVWSDEVGFWVWYPTLIQFNNDTNRYDRIGFDRDPSTQTLQKITISPTYGQSYFYTLDYESSADTKISRLTDVTYTKGTESSPPISLTWTGCSGISSSCDFLETIDNGQGGITTFAYTTASKYPVLRKVTNNNGFGSAPYETFAYSGASTSNNSLVFGIVTATRSDGTVTTTRNIASSDKFGLPSSVEQTGPIPLKTTYGWGVNSGFVRMNEVRTEHKNSSGSTAGSTKNTFVYDPTNFFNLVSVTSDGNSRNRIIVSYDGWINNLPAPQEWWRPTGVKVKEVVGGVETLRNAKTWRYNSHGYVESVIVQTDSGGTQATTGIGYDSKGNPSQITDPQGNVTTIGYDASLHLLPAKVTQPTVNNIQLTSSVLYDYTFGKPGRTTDPNGKTTSYTYDYAGRPFYISYPDGTAMSYDYGNFNASTSSPQYSRTWRYGGGSNETFPLAIEYLDGFGRQIQTVTPISDTSRSKTTTRYDATGNVSAVWGPYTSSDWNYNGSPSGSIPKQTFTYNSKGQLEKVDQALSSTANATTTFGFNGFTRTVTDPDGRKTTAIADDLGRIIKVTDAMNNVSNYVYDALNNLLGITATPSGKASYQVVTSAYDLRGLMTSVTRPGEGTRNLTYDLNGNLLSEIVPGDNSITKVYDALGRVTNTTESKSGKRTLYSKFYYDACSGATNVKGRLCKATRDGITNEFPSYDAMGRVLTEKKTIGTMGYATAFSYDIYGRLASITHPDATRIVYSYVTGTDLPKTITTGAGQILADVSYTAGDLVGRITYGNGTHVDNAYDPISLRLGSKKSFNAAGTLLQGWSYLFSNAGDMKSKTDLKTNAAGVYTYDALHRITLETTASGATVSNFVYEPYGNLSYKFEPNPTDGLQGRTYTYDPTYHHKLQKTVLGSTATYSYDINGNMTSLVSQPSENYSYGVNGLLELSWNPSILAGCYKNSYDAFGARSAKNGPFACNTSSGPSQRNYVSPDYEASSDNATREVYVTLGGEKIAKIGNGSAITWLHHDHLGSTTMTTNSSGQSTDTADYDLFGQLRSGKISATNYLYTGQEYDSENGLYYYKSRYYDPSLGRFASPDSIIPGIYDSQAFASYNYVGNNPVTYTDPDGHVRETEIFNTLAWLITLDWDHPARLSMECLYWMFRIEQALGLTVSERDSRDSWKAWATTRKKHTTTCREYLHLGKKTQIKASNFIKPLSPETLATTREIMKAGGTIDQRELDAVGGVPGILAAIRQDTYRGMQLMINLLHEQIQGPTTTTTTTTTTAANTALNTLPSFDQQFGLLARLPIPQPQLPAQPQPQPQSQLPLAVELRLALLLYSLNMPRGSQ